MNETLTETPSQQLIEHVAQYFTDPLLRPRLTIGNTPKQQIILNGRRIIIGVRIIRDHSALEFFRKPAREYLPCKDQLGRKIIVDQAQAVAARNPAQQQQVDKFLSELGWREFSYHLLYHFPAMAEEPFKPQFKHFPWLGDQTALTAWQQACHQSSGSCSDHNALGRLTRSGADC